LGAARTQPNFKFVVIDQKIEGERATVRFKDEKGKEQKLDLAKIDGLWLVDVRQ